MEKNLTRITFVISNVELRYNFYFLKKLFLENKSFLIKSLPLK